VRLLQLHHPHTLHVFGSTTIHGRLYRTRYQASDHHRQDQADDECPRFKPAKQKRTNSNSDKQRPPNLSIAQGRHEQVQNGARPSLIDEMKKRLIHTT
jgi:hypothetical protein